MATRKKTPNRYPPYLLARQIAALKSLSDDTGISVMQYIRDAIDEYLEKRKRKKKRPSR
jgi:predicted DNA-binding protein